MAAHEEPGKSFEKWIEYTETGLRYLFAVPDEFVGVKDGLLVAEHPDFMLRAEGNDRIVLASKVELIEKFPAASEKWYLADSKHGIPIGEEVGVSNPVARYLWRIDKRVGLVARGYDYNGCDLRRNVYGNFRPGDGLGVVVEISETDAPR